MFYRDDKVLTVSIHGDPADFYPFYSGFPTETGAGRGAGYNLNFSLPAKTTFDAWMVVFEDSVVPAVTHFSPDYIVLAAGFDTYVHDPIGDFLFDTDNYETIGRRVRKLGCPTLVVQEGGYYTPYLGKNVVSLLHGFAA